AGPPRAAWRTRLLAAGAVAWVVIQLALPLRHLAYPGDHRWTGEGYRFGWNVLLVERMASVTFLVHDPATGRTTTFDPDRLYTPAQLRVMRSEPDLIQQAARAIAAHEAAEGHQVEVHVDAWLSLNGRPAQRWIDPDVDLAAEPRTPWHKRWILDPG
ncbi:MAG: Vitamin K-dependent gamma-carboxylase, partial [Ilumatobacteraceae bacterium]|nr:Vitamin K-dependent gamma-carboxylase [Ilumatobacteraceae bacterium]